MAGRRNDIFYRRRGAGGGEKAGRRFVKERDVRSEKGEDEETSWRYTRRKNVKIEDGVCGVLWKRKKRLVAQQDERWVMQSAQRTWPYLHIEQNSLGHRVYNCKERRWERNAMPDVVTSCEM